MAINVKRKEHRFYPNPKRIIARSFVPGGDERVGSVIQNIMKLPDETVHAMLSQVLRNFSKRHRNITRVFEKSFDNVKETISRLKIDPDSLSSEKRLLIGSYFTMEYSIECAAFYNPSIVEDPYQANLKQGEKRIIVSFRATGEGHISSIVFRSGKIDRNNELHFKEPGAHVDAPEGVKRHVYDKKAFLQKLDEMDVHKDIVKKVMDRLGDTFIYGELQASIEEVEKKTKLSYTRHKVIQAMNWLASSHYEIAFSMDTAISERVIFPISYTESNGIEDARFVKFTEDDGSMVYYATYTAYNGYSILPKLLKTKDFYHFEVKPIHGECAKNKGMALFPRRINGRYAMLSRVDGVNNYVMFSENTHFWQHAEMIQSPCHPWEFIQTGNAGSPLETEKGWLLITHGVGPMRTYGLGATLLDLERPAKVIGHLKEPLLIPNEEEREGYVPNVVYSCGSIIHNGELIIPYGISDYAAAFATVPLDELMDELLR